MTILKLVLIELWKRKSQLITGLLAITLGIAVIVAIQSIAVVSEQNVARNLDNLGANILILPQAASIDDYYTSDIDAPTLPMDYVERILQSTIAGVDNMSPKLTRRILVNGKSVVLTGSCLKARLPPSHCGNPQDFLVNSLRQPVRQIRQRINPMGWKMKN